MYTNNYNAINNDVIMQKSLPAVQLWPPYGKFLIVYFLDMQRIMYMGICNKMADLEYATY